MNWKKLALFLGIAFVLYCVLNYPEQSGEGVNQTAGGFGYAASQIHLFIKSLFS